MDTAWKRTSMYVGLLLATFGSSAMADTGFTASVAAVASVSPDTDELAAYQQINQEYLSQIKPMFEDKCANCHSSDRKLPWYALGGAGGSWNPIASDVRGGRAALEISAGFPFHSAENASQAALLHALRGAVASGNMPPMKYRAIHWGSGLSKDDKANILAWIDGSLAKLDTLRVKKTAVREQLADAVRRILDDNCSGCHGAKSKKGPTNLTDLNALVSSRYFDKKDPEHSALYQSVESGKMPADDELKKEDKDALLVWMKAQAGN